MKDPYVRLLPYAFKRFSLLSALRTGFPTVQYYLLRKPLPPSEKPALFTMNILPPLMTVWYHVVQKALGDRIDITIFDCSGKLDPKEFPSARVQKFLNLYAATKCDEFLYSIAKNRKIAWICDDDMFPLSTKMLDVLEREFHDSQTASVSFRPRPWWHFEIDGKNYEVSSSYCTAFNREIFCEKEHLSLAPAQNNPHPSDIGRPPKRYDTFDYANEVLIRKGYRCTIVPQHDREEYLTGFSGISGAVMLLNYFHTSKETLAYYKNAPQERWGGNMLFGTLQAMIAITIIQDLYTMIRGKPYPLPSLPSQEALKSLVEEHRHQLRKDQLLEPVEKAGERLRAMLNNH